MSSKSKPAAVTDGATQDQGTDAAEDFASKSDFLDVDHSRYDVIRVPGIARPVRVRGLRGTEWSRIQQEVAGKGKLNYLAMVMQAGTVRSDGSQQFGIEEIGKLATLPMHVLSPIAAAITRCSNVTEEEQKKLEDKSEVRDV